MASNITITGKEENKVRHIIYARGIFEVKLSILQIQCDVLAVKKNISLVDDDNDDQKKILQILELDIHNVLFLALILCIVSASQEIESCNLIKPPLVFLE